MPPGRNALNESRVVFQTTGVHPRPRWSFGRECHKTFGVLQNRDADSWTTCSQVGIGKQIRAPGQQTGSQGRERRRPYAGAKNDDWLRRRHDPICIFFSGRYKDAPATYFFQLMSKTSFLVIGLLILSYG